MDVVGRGGMSAQRGNGGFEMPVRVDITPTEARVLIRAMAGSFVDEDAPHRWGILRKLAKVRRASERLSADAQSGDV